MDPSDHYADPLGEALSYSSQRAAQLVSLAVAAAQVAAHRKALSEARRAARDEQARRALREEQRAIYEQARARWAPAHDPRWLAQADLLQAARAWGAATAYADADPVAASAMRKSEERLRTLHPYAMGRYDRLRTDGASPPDAMREAAPLFTRKPHARPGQPGTQLRLEAAMGGPDADPVAGATDSSLRPPAPDQDPDQHAEHRGHQIVWHLQARAHAQRGSELDPAELATALEATTNLPAEVIARLARARSEEAVAAGAERARAADLDRAASARRISGQRAARAASRTLRALMPRPTAVPRNWQPRASPARQPMASGPPPAAAFSGRPGRLPPQPSLRVPSGPACPHDILEVEECHERIG